MFRYNPKANYQPNGGQYLQILSGKDLYKQMIVISIKRNDTFSSDDTFPASFPNIFVDYPLGQMPVGDKLWTNWNKAPLKLWQTQLNFAVWCASSAYGVSSEHLNYKKHYMVRALYRFHVYYHVRRILKRLQVPVPQESSFRAADNPYTNEEFFKICEDYGVPNDPTKYKDEKFYWTYQCGSKWSDDYIGPDSMTRWIIEKSQGFTEEGLYRISESVRAYAYLVLSSQASVRSNIIANTASALTTQKAFLNNFEDVVNRKVDIREDIKRYQDTLSYASSKVDYSMGENIYMLPGDMNLKVRSGTARYNNKIFISDGKFSLGKNDKVNAGPANALKPEEKATIHKGSFKNVIQKPIITHEEEKIASILSLIGLFTIWYMFR